MKQFFIISGYLAIKEIWRNRSRFLLIGLVVALITLLVLFIAALGEGLGNGNREYLSKLDAELIAFQKNSDLIIQSSRLGENRLRAIKNVRGVEDVGMLGTSSANILPKTDKTPLKVALLGVQTGHVGEPTSVSGKQLKGDSANDVIIDQNTAIRSGLAIGDTITIRVTQGTDDKFYDLQVVGIAEGQQFSLQPSIFVPFATWDQIRPKSEAEINNPNPVANVILIKLTDPSQIETVKARLVSEVENVEIATKKETIEALPGYSAQQSTLNTQGGFTLFIGILVIGGFFQIQVLQKVAQIGVLKAIGATNSVVAFTAVIQILIVTLAGVSIGGLLALGFSLLFPPTVPIVFNGTNLAIAIISLILIGPLGGLVSIRNAVRIEPLKALGLSS